MRAQDGVHDQRGLQPAGDLLRDDVDTVRGRRRLPDQPSGRNVRAADRRDLSPARDVLGDDRDELHGRLTKKLWEMVVIGHFSTAD